MGIELFVWIVLSYGLMNIVVYGEIFSNFREFFNKNSIGENGINIICKFIYNMITCPMCFSTWVGFFLGMFLYSPMNNVLDIPSYYSWFFDGIFSSGAVWIVNSIVEFFEENRINNKKDIL